MWQVARFVIKSALRLLAVAFPDLRFSWADVTDPGRSLPDFCDSVAKCESAWVSERSEVCLSGPLPRVPPGRQGTPAELPGLCGRSPGPRSSSPVGQAHRVSSLRAKIVLCGWTPLILADLCYIDLAAEQKKVVLRNFSRYRYNKLKSYLKTS